MSFAVEFVVPTEEFAFDHVLDRAPTVDLPFEAVVPTGADRGPFVWATSDDFDAFGGRVLDNERVSDAVQLDRVEDEALYRVERSPGEGGP